jgi:hypothetical protein
MLKLVALVALLALPTKLMQRMQMLSVGAILPLLALAAHVAAFEYSLHVDEVYPVPVLSYVDGSSAFEQVFNPSYVPPSASTRGTEGLLIRTQNCSAKVGGPCVQCGGSPSTARFALK